jgi:hypothetical protein
LSFLWCGHGRELTGENAYVDAFCGPNESQNRVT